MNIRALVGLSLDMVNILMKNRDVGISAPKRRMFLFSNLNVRLVETLFQRLELSDLMGFKSQKKYI